MIVMYYSNRKAPSIEKKCTESKIENFVSSSLVTTKEETPPQSLRPFTTFEGRRENLNSILKANLRGWEVKT